MGDPWAGHVSVFGTASWAISRDKSDVPENLGAEPPTGSTQERQLTCVEMLIQDGHTKNSKNLILKFVSSHFMPGSIIGLTTWILFRLRHISKAYGDVARIVKM